MTEEDIIQAVRQRLKDLNKELEEMEQILDALENLPLPQEE